jgi:hypothetical protein
MEGNKKIVLWVSIGIVGSILINALYKNIRKKGGVSDTNPTLDNEMKDLIEKIKKEPK